MTLPSKLKSLSFDLRRKMVIPGNLEETLQYAVKDWIETARQAIKDHGYFAVALSGGGTPKYIYKCLADNEKKSINWKKVFLFWSDERVVSKNHAESNFNMAMEAGLKKLPIPENQIFPMETEGDLEKNAKAYEALIFDAIPNKHLDLMMLGMGEDGHTASLFPKTHGLHAPGRLVIANFLPDKDIWRLSVTFDCIHQAAKTVIYITGESKAEITKLVFQGPYQPDLYPIQRVGTEDKPALFILDNSAAKLLLNKFKV